MLQRKKCIFFEGGGGGGGVDLTCDPSTYTIDHPCFMENSIGLFQGLIGLMQYSDPLL